MSVEADPELRGNEPITFTRELREAAASLLFDNVRKQALLDIAAAIAAASHAMYLRPTQDNLTTLNGFWVQGVRLMQQKYEPKGIA